MGLLHPRRKVYIRRNRLTGLLRDYVLSAVRKMYRPAGDERQATRRNGSGVSNRLHVLNNHKSRRKPP